MDKVRLVARSGGMIAFLSIGIVIALVAGCGEDNKQSNLTTTSAGVLAPTPRSVGSVGQLAPNVTSTTTPRTLPDFQTVTPPPIPLDNPDRPQVDRLIVGKQGNSLVLLFQNLRVRGTIATVKLDLIDLVTGVDLVKQGVINSSSYVAFQNALIGRGNLPEDTDVNGVTNLENGSVSLIRDGGTSTTSATYTGSFFRYQFLTDPNQALLFIPSRILATITITDTYGQQLVVQASSQDP